MGESLALFTVRYLRTAGFLLRAAVNGLQEGFVHNGSSSAIHFVWPEIGPNDQDDIWYSPPSQNKLQNALKDLLFAAASCSKYKSVHMTEDVGAVRGSLGRFTLFSFTAEATRKGTAQEQMRSVLGFHEVLTSYPAENHLLASKSHNIYSVTNIPI